MLDSGILAGNIPRNGCIAFLRIPGMEDIEVFTDYLEKEKKLYCVPGHFFGAPDHIRLGIGEISPEKLNIALICFKEGLDTFQSFDR